MCCLGAHYAVAPRFTPEDLGWLKQQVFATLVCDRPGGEGAGQAVFPEIEAEARKHGMQALHLHVTPSRIIQPPLTPSPPSMAERRKPVLGFCRTGMRAEASW
ncbi:beta-lactamase hydrolase domain-containing protein [Massilia sp. DD77]|uniref:beta-lactamase hydrolase domain-containing protein n=1 Tax=Massilia sp. DD77 TaxID=3109349 RepID=UPI003000B388